jgi:hypothetical protein
MVCGSFIRPSSQSVLSPDDLEPRRDPLSPLLRARGVLAGLEVVVIAEDK